MEAIELRCAAGGSDHCAEENDVRPPRPNFIQHLIIAQAVGATIEHGHLGRFFLSNERGDLGMEWVHRQVTVTPRCPVSHGGGNKQKFHDCSYIIKGWAVEVKVFNTLTIVKFLLD
jgi:hypothetical protein